MAATPVIAVDRIKEKREKALALGADYAVGPFADDFVKTMLDLTDGRGINAAVGVTGKGGALDYEMTVFEYSDAIATICSSAVDINGFIQY